MSADRCEPAGHDGVAAIRPDNEPRQPASLASVPPPAHIYERAVRRDVADLEARFEDGAALDREVQQDGIQMRPRHAQAVDSLVWSVTTAGVCRAYHATGGGVDQHPV